MASGFLSIVLHAHLPFVRHPERTDVLEELWLHEAITGTYLPLLQAFEGLVTDGVPYRCTVSLSAGGGMPERMYSISPADTCLCSSGAA